MSVCKACGAPIIWIKLQSGKSMPCDAMPIHFQPYGGYLKLISDDGIVFNNCAACDESELVGYMSHFATCPAAGQFRKRGQS